MSGEVIASLPKLKSDNLMHGKREVRLALCALWSKELLSIARSFSRGDAYGGHLSLPFKRKYESITDLRFFDVKFGASSI